MPSIGGGCYASAQPHGNEVGLQLHALAYQLAAFQSCTELPKAKTSISTKTERGGIDGFVRAR